MIIGLLPVGGEGIRLGLPFAKEMLPIKNLHYYKPVVGLIVDKMVAAGAEKIFMVHGLEYKQTILDYFYENKYIHIRQKKTGFSRVLYDFYENYKISDNDEILFALPDVVFDDNPFPDLLKNNGIICGLFKTLKESKVDRLNRNGLFDIKSSKNQGNSDYFWGVIKFDGLTLKKICDTIDFDNVNEIGEICNKFEFNTIEFGDYLDLGTWSNLNFYWNNW